MNTEYKMPLRFCNSGTASLETNQLYIVIITHGKNEKGELIIEQVPAHYRGKDEDFGEAFIGASHFLSSRVISLDEAFRDKYHFIGWRAWQDGAATVLPKDCVSYEQ